MKRKLMVQSLSPLALLTVIRNLRINLYDKNGLILSGGQIVKDNLTLIIVLSVCCIWLLFSIIYYFEFKAFKWVDRVGGYEVANVRAKDEESLNFFLTIIIPLLIDDVETVQGALTFMTIVLILCILLYRTKLFYANPVLAMLGYHFFELCFVDNPDYPEKCFVIAQTEGVKDGDVVEYKQISGRVIFVKGKK